MGEYIFKIFFYVPSSRFFIIIYFRLENFKSYTYYTKNLNVP